MNELEYKRKSIKLIDINMIIMIIITYVYNFQTSRNGNVLTNCIIMEFCVLQFILMLRTKKIKIHKTMIFLTIFSFFSLISFFWSVYPTNTITKSKTLFYNIFFFSSLLWYLKDKQRIEIFMKALGLAGMIAAIYSIINSSFLQGVRTTDVIGNANTMAAYLSYAALISLYYFFKEENSKFFYLVSYIAISFAILITGSRMGFIMLLTGTFFTYLIFNSINKENMFKFFLKVIFIIFILYLFYVFTQKNTLLYSILGIRIQSLIEIITGQESSISENSTFERIEMSKLAFKVFCQYPLQGCGLGGIAHYIKEYITGYYTFCHNNYMELLSGVGILGFSCYYANYINIIKNLRKVKVLELTKFSKIMVFELLISHFFLVQYYYKFEYIYLALIVSISTYYLSRGDNNDE